MNTALTNATTAETTAIAAETAADTAKTTKEGEKTTVSTGLDAVVVTKTTAKTAATGLYDTAVTNEAADWTNNYKPAKLVLDKADKLKAYVLAGCVFNSGATTCVGVANSTILAMKTSADSA